MVTKEQAMTEDHFHFGECSESFGPQGGSRKVKQIRVRRNGATKTWKRNPERFRVPVKHGLYEYGEITEANADQFHTARSCSIQ